MESNVALFINEFTMKYGMKYLFTHRMPFTLTHCVT